MISGTAPLTSAKVGFCSTEQWEASTVPELVYPLRPLLSASTTGRAMLAPLSICFTDVSAQPMLTCLPPRSQSSTSMRSGRSKSPLQSVASGILTAAQRGLSVLSMCLF